MEQQYNMKSPAVKRLMREAKELHQPTEEFSAQPLEDNLFEWHFTVRGPPDSEFDGGIYHGRIVLPADYPMKPPSIILLTPNGRFEINKKICLSISGHHPESWQPCWSIRTALLAIIGFMPTSGKGAIGALDYTPKERKILAKKSQDWKCSACGPVKELLLTRTENFSSTNEEAKELASQISFKGEGDPLLSETNSTESTNGNAAAPSWSQVVKETFDAVSHTSHSSTSAMTSNMLPSFSLKVGLPVGTLSQPELLQQPLDKESHEISQNDGNQVFDEISDSVRRDESSIRHRTAETVASELPSTQINDSQRPTISASNATTNNNFSTAAAIIFIIFILSVLILRRLFWMLS